MSNMSDKAQKRIVELHITEAQRARDYEHGFCDGYLDGYTEAINNAVESLLKDSAGRKKGTLPDAEIRPIGKAERR